MPDGEIQHDAKSRHIPIHPGWRTYRNEDSKNGRHAYKARFALLPTIDHLAAEASEGRFRVCGWRTNDAKNDLPLESFLEVCEKELRHAGYRVERD